MKDMLPLLAVLLLLIGCQTGKSTQTHYLDGKEFGQATRASLERQIANPNAVITTVPKGVAGINAERMMIVHNDGFGEVCEDSKVFTIELAK